MRLAVALLLLSLPLIGACTASPPAGDLKDGARPAASSAGPTSAPAEGEWFTDRAHEAGIDFVHFNGMTGKFYQPEIMAPGVALFDYDNDGDLDVLLVQGELLGSGTPLIPPPPGPLTDRLYRNDLEVKPDGTRVLHFTDVTSQSGLALHGYGMGEVEQVHVARVTLVPDARDADLRLVHVRLVHAGGVEHGLRGALGFRLRDAAADFVEHEFR